MRRGALLAGSLAVGVALAWTQFALTSRMMDSAQNRTPLQSAALHTAEPPEQQPPDEIVEPAPPVAIEADATQTVAEDPAAFREICDALGAASGQGIPPVEMPHAAPASKEETDAGPNWFVWGRMATDRSPVTLPTALPDDKLRVYVVHSPQGATVCIINRTEQKIPISLQLRLPRGVYKWERLSFATPLPPDEHGMLSAATWREGGGSAPSLMSSLVRLQGMELAEAGPVVKPGILQPGERCLYRCTDVSREARAAVYETRTRIQEMARNAPDSAHRLRRILDEGGDFLDYVCAGGSGTRDRRIGGIHHLMLITSQAHALHHNFQERHTVSAETGAATMGALERLTDGLAETSAAILGLVPQIVVEPETAPESASPQEARATAYTVTVSIANTGSRSVEAVKIGLDSSVMPAGTRTDPEDPAYFGTLHPGQTVRAVFHLRIPASQPAPANRCVGDVSYFVAVAPAHLRPRPW